VRRLKAIELTRELEQAQEQHQLHRYLRRFAAFDLIVLDELTSSGTCRSVSTRPTCSSKR
jgi:hypothetical protein